jgi:hypothetical protein
MINPKPPLTKPELTPILDEFVLSENPKRLLKSIYRFGRGPENARMVWSAADAQERLPGYALEPRASIAGWLGVLQRNGLTSRRYASVHAHQLSDLGTQLARHIS